MTTRTWNNLAGGSWSAGLNWTGGVAPVAGDDAVINSRYVLGYTVSLPKASYSLNSLTLAARGTTVALDGSTITAASANITSGTMKGGTLAGPSFNIGNAVASSDVAILDGMTISGAVHVGTAATPASLTVQNSLAFAAPGTAFEFAGKGEDLSFVGPSSVANASLIIDAGASVGVGGSNSGDTMTIGAGGTADVRGALTLGTGVTLAGPMHVASGGTLNFGSSAGIAAGASLNLDAGAWVLITENVATDQFMAFANQSSKAVGAKLEYQGIVTNIGKTIDLTAGGAAARITANGSLVGGTLANSGAKTALQFGDLTGVTLRGAFAADGQLSGGLTIRNGLTVQAADGSAGTLDLTSTPTSLTIKAPTDGSTSTTLSNMTIQASDIFAEVLTYLAPTTQLRFASGADVDINGPVVNQGTIAVADNAGATLGTGAGGSQFVAGRSRTTAR